jgi:hypothetical protein
MASYIEIVGLADGSNGRKCSAHLVCGRQIAPGNLVRLLPTVIVNELGQNEYAIGVRIVKGGRDSCLVGFIPREFHAFRTLYENKYAQILELLANSKNSEHRRKSYKSKGLAIASLLES